MSHVIESDRVSLDILRSRLQATVEEGAITIERTAISPAISESRDYSCTLLEANGDLIAAGGAVTYHFGVCGHSVRATLARHGDSIAPGDLFFANDPHDGGGLHAQDVMIQLPVFVEDTLVAWIVNSGHMIDMGGMVFGSWSPDAMDCYQEALRMPPVRIMKAGSEQVDFWSIIRTNIRMAEIVEMDMRSLIAGCHIASNKIIQIAESIGVTELLTGISELRELAEQEMRRRISTIEDGNYRYTTWIEWHEERLRLPCQLEVSGDHLTFSFEGAPTQTTHFFNSKPHIITSMVVSDCSDVLAFDLPLNQGMFEPVQVWCPAGTIVNSSPPAPVASAHIDVALNAGMAAQQCVMMALEASDEVTGNHLVAGPSAGSAIAVNTWSYVTPSGSPDGWMMMDGTLPGSSAAKDRDGSDSFAYLVGRRAILEAVDVEMLEWWYPVLVREKGLRRGAFGAGRFRSGAGCHMAFESRGIDHLTGSLLAVREKLPLNGVAGGQPGATSEFFLQHVDGTRARIPGKASGVEVVPGDVLEFELGCGGGFGDPIDRPPAEVARDVRLKRLTAEEAAEVYGVVIDGGVADDDATVSCRTALLRDRLAQSSPPRRPVSNPGVETAGARPLYPGVEQRGSVAYATNSGAPLATAPDFWADGCRLIERIVDDSSTIHRSYLDPVTGHVLLSEVVPRGEGCTIEVLPRRWTSLAPLSGPSGDA